MKGHSIMQGIPECSRHAYTTCNTDNRCERSMKWRRDAHAFFHHESQLRHQEDKHCGKYCGGGWEDLSNSLQVLFSLCLQDLNNYVKAFWHSFSRDMIVDMLFTCGHM